MIGSVALDTSLVLLGLEAQSPEQVIRALSARLHARGVVTETFADAAVRRELEYPTGLPTAIPVALPHTDAVHVVESAIAIAVPAQPVPFAEMGNPDGTVQARIVFLLALKNAADQVPWLQRLIFTFRDETFLQSLVRATDEQAIVELMRNYFDVGVIGDTDCTVKSPT